MTIFIRDRNSFSWGILVRDTSIVVNRKRGFFYFCGSRNFNFRNKEITIKLLLPIGIDREGCQICNRQPLAILILLRRASKLPINN